MSTRLAAGWRLHVGWGVVCAAVLAASLMGTGDAARGQETKAGGAKTVVKKLLQVRAPSADWRKAVAGRSGANWAQPPRELLESWMTEDGGLPDANKLSAERRELFLKAAEEYPEELAEVLAYVPEGNEAGARVKAVYDKMGKDASWTGTERDEWMAQVRRWLLLHGYFREDLIKEADGLSGDDSAWATSCMRELIRVDWPKAQETLNVTIYRATAGL